MPPLYARMGRSYNIIVRGVDHMVKGSRFLVTRGDSCGVHSRDYFPTLEEALDFYRRQKTMLLVVGFSSSYVSYPKEVR